MSFTEEEFRARYGTQQIDSDEDDELLGYKSDDVIVTSSGHHGDHASPSDLDYQYEQELDYEEVEDIDHEEFDNTNRAQVRISLHELISHACTCKVEPLYKGHLKLGTSNCCP